MSSYLALGIGINIELFFNVAMLIFSPHILHPRPEELLQANRKCAVTLHVPGVFFVSLYDFKTVAMFISLYIFDTPAQLKKTLINRKCSDNLELWECLR